MKGRRNLLSLFRVLQVKPLPQSGQSQSQSQSLRSRLLSSSSTEKGPKGRKGGWWWSFGRQRVIPIVLISVTGGVALSAVNDLAIFHGCSSKAMEKARENAQVREALGEPMVRGPWYEASLAVGHRRNTVSCTFPASGPHGSAIFHFKAVRTRDRDSLFSFLRHHDWDILLMDALLHVPSTTAAATDDNEENDAADDPHKTKTKTEEKSRTFRLSLTDIIAQPPSPSPSAGPVPAECKHCDSAARPQQVN